MISLETLKHLPPSPVAIATKIWIRKTIRPKNLPREKATKHFRRVCASTPIPEIIPSGFKVLKQDVAGVPCSYITRKNTESKRNHSRQTIIYFHGGGMVAGHPETYHTFCASFAKRLEADVYIPDYKLAPEHRFPIGVTECFNVYKALIDDGLSGQNIILMGDSAGGSICLALLHMIRDHELPNPKCAVMMSPASDMRYTSGELERNDKSDVMLSADLIRGLGEDYVSSEEDRLNPYASPILKDFDEQTPPMFIAASANECLYGDTEKLVKKAQNNGARVNFYVRKNMFHVWPIMYPVLPEALIDVYQMCRFIKSV